ncbi:MAG: type II toxin-antitoxin system Phd/YefM family antitoxin [Spartobacteria bacterium]|nr:type II toxin-antitoxin system Phd/YefM family antitoxin [Spartobacteria bacterium]
MTTLTASDARREFFSLLRDTSEKHQITRIHHKNGDAVMMSEEEYESMVETLELLSIPGFREATAQALKEDAAGDTLSFDEVFGEPQ